MGGHAGDVDAIEDNGAGARARRAADGHHQGGLAGAVGADQRDDLAFLDVDVDALEGLDLAVEGLHAADSEKRVAHERPPFFRRLRFPCRRLLRRCGLLGGDFFAGPGRGLWLSVAWNNCSAAADPRGCLLFHLFLIFDAQIGADDGRIVLHMCRRAVRNLHAVVEHDDVVGNAHDHAHVVFDQQDRHVFVLADVEQQRLRSSDSRGLRPAAGSSRQSRRARCTWRGRSPAGAGRHRAGRRRDRRRGR